MSQSKKPSSRTSKAAKPAADADRGLAAVRRSLDAIERDNGNLGAFLIVTGEQALAEAAAQEATAHKGPLAGLPIGVKDIIDLTGHPTRAGSKTRAQVAPAEKDAFVVAKLRAAGAIVVGKTNTVEYAFGGWGTNPEMGAPWNPWDLGTHRVPGGSSSGSGVAVGAGLAPAAIGSDTGGSVRIPAAFNGVVGLKTTFGSISLHGAYPLSTTLDTIGPLTRTTEDAARLFEAMAGPDPRDPGTFHRPSVALPDFAHPDIRGMRIAMVAEKNLPASGVDAEVKAAWRNAAEVFRGLGATVEELAFPFDMDELTVRNGQLIAAEGFAIHRAYIEDPKLPIGQYVRARMLGGKGVTAADYIAAREHQRRTARQFVEWMDGWDAYLAPGAPMPAIPVASVDEQVSPATMTRAGNYFGACGLSLPSGFSKGGLPLGIQLIARPYDERALFRLGAGWESATDWHRRHPDLKALLG